MKIVHFIKDNTLCVELDGELDEYTASYCRSYIDDLLESCACPHIVLELQKVSFMDSTGIGVILGRYKKIKSLNRILYISTPNRQVDKLLSLSGIYTIMPKIS